VRRIFKSFIALLIVILLSIRGNVSAQQQVPELNRRVTDLVSLLKAYQISELENRLEQFEKSKGSQVAVLIVSTTAPEAIEQYSIRVASQWKLGRKGVDDGVLLLVAQTDRKVRIEVGYGLEGVLNDATAKRIIDEIIVPEFKSGNFYNGISNGVGAIIKVASGEQLPPAKKPDFLSSLRDVNPFFIIFLLFILFFMAASYDKMRLYKSKGGGRGSSSGWSSAEVLEEVAVSEVAEAVLEEVAAALVVGELQDHGKNQTNLQYILSDLIKG
jgi:uncharacterized membrane protein YgcG